MMTIFVGFFIHWQRNNSEPEYGRRVTNVIIRNNLPRGDGVTILVSSIEEVDACLADIPRIFSAVLIMLRILNL